VQGESFSHHESPARGDGTLDLLRRLWLNYRAEPGKPPEEDLCPVHSPFLSSLDDQQVGAFPQRTCEKLFN
jgi:hypothetical protein